MLGYVLSRIDSACCSQADRKNKSKSRLITCGRMNARRFVKNALKGTKESDGFHEYSGGRLYISAGKRDVTRPGGASLCTFM